MGLERLLLAAWATIVVCSRRRSCRALSSLHQSFRTARTAFVESFVPAMEKVRAWLARRGFELTLGGRCDYVDYVEGVVNISTRQSAKMQLHSALHECGHVDLFRLRALQKRRTYAGAAWRRWAGRFQGFRSRTDRLLVLEEEVEAWRRGEAVGRRLKLRLPSVKAQEAHRSRSLCTYVRWVGSCPRKVASPR